jgi:type I restriction enzyme S subunit
VTDGWKSVRLGDVADLNGGYAFKSTQYTEAGRFVLRTVNIRDDFSITRDGATFISEQEAQEYSRFALQDKDTLFVMVAATLGKVGYVRRDSLPALLNQNMWVIRAKLGLIDPDFLQFCFRELSKIPLAWVSGSARSFLRRDDVRNLEFLLPPLPEQRAIAATLGALDDKIELNRRMNGTLEAMARALFRDWFVYFGPTRAKMAGEAPYLSSDLWSIFPDRLDDAGKPERWDIQPLTAFFMIIGGGTPKTSNPAFWDGPIPWFSVKDTPAQGSVFVTATEKTITEAGLTGSSARLILKGTTIISARGTVGNLAVAGCAMTFNQSCYALSGAGSVGDCATYLIAQNMVSQLQTMAHGSVFSTITRQTFDALSLPMPPPSILTAFEDAVSPLFEMILANVNESQTLAQTRDLLLPRLMSGELRVQDLPEIMGGGI